MNKAVLLVAVLLVAVAAYFFYFQPFAPKPFEQGFNELKLLMGEDFEAFTAMKGGISNERIAEIDGKLFEFRNGLSPANYSDVKALTALTELYSAMLEVNLHKNSLTEQKEAVAALQGGELCDSFPEVELLGEQTQELIDKTAEVKSLLDSFNFSYSQFSPIAGTDKMELDIEEMDRIKAEQGEYIATMEAICSL